MNGYKNDVWMRLFSHEYRIYTPLSDPVNFDVVPGIPLSRGFRTGYPCAGRVLLPLSRRRIGRYSRAIPPQCSPKMTGRGNYDFCRIVTSRPRRANTSSTFCICSVFLPLSRSITNLLLKPPSPATSSCVSPCFLRMARTRAPNSDVVVNNTALFSVVSIRSHINNRVSAWTMLTRR